MAKIFPMELQVIQNKIYEIRGRRVMLDFDLAALYGTETAQLKRAVRRNIERFEGEDFMFELSTNEYNSLITNLRCQNGTSNEGSNRGGTRYMPFAFTELGVAMLSSVLNSNTAIEINRGIMRAFVMMRHYLVSVATITAELSEIRAKLALLERNDEVLAQNDENTLGAVNDLSEDFRKEISALYTALGEMAALPAVEEKPRRRIGYRRAGEE